MLFSLIANVKYYLNTSYLRREDVKLYLFYLKLAAESGVI
jgi:hypothetical protein